MYVKVTDGVGTPYTIKQLRDDYPNVSFPNVISNSILANYNVFPIVDVSPPSHTVTHELVAGVEQIDGVWYRSWSLIERDIAVAQQLALEQFANDRYEKETTGINWVDINSDTWFIDTSLDSQAKITSAATSVQNNVRQENGVWKLAKVINDTQIIQFRPTTNAEIIEWANLVHAHVQKCFEAEANAVSKVMSGDFTTTFEQEFNLLV